MLGTFQVLTVAWIQDRQEHRRQLRALRSELKRLLSFKQRFNWRESGGPQSDYVPNPPTTSPRYGDLVTEIDWYLTDEHSEDNAQEALIGLMDGCRLLRHDHGLIQAKFAELKGENGRAEREEIRGQIINLAEHYDNNLDVLHYGARSGLDDVQRRLDLLNWRKQITRSFRDLPRGENPAPIGVGDDRLKELSAVSKERNGG